MSRLKIIFSVFWLLFLVNCSSSSSDSPASPAVGADQGKNNNSGLVAGNDKFKIAVLKLLEGSYGQNCLRKAKGDVQTSAGSAISVSGTTVSWVGGTHDLTKVLMNEFSLSVSQKDSMVAAGFDIKDPATGGRVAVYGIQVSSSGYSSATVTSNESSTEVRNWCTGNTLPAAVGKSLWGIARQFINVNETNLDCIDSTDSRSFKGAAVFNDTVAKVDTASFPRTSSTLEHLSVNDTETSLPIGLSFTAYDTTNAQVTVTIDSNLKLNTIQITRPDLTTLTCTSP